MEHYSAYLTAGYLAEALLKSHMRAAFGDGPGIYEGDAIRFFEKLAHEMGYRVEKIESWKQKATSAGVDPRVDAVCEARPGWSTEHSADQEQIRAAVVKDLAVADAAMEAANG